MSIVALLFALTINSVTPQTVSSADDVITVAASASGLQSSTQYLQVAIKKNEDGARHFGLTKNLKEEWYQYKSSPSDFADYFFSFTPASGTWSGQLSARLDMTSPYFKGSGSYLLKLYKYVTSSSNSDSNPVPITVNIPAVAVSQNSPEEPEQPKPKAEISVQGSAFLGEPFKISLDMKDFESNKDYYLKIRAGLEEGRLTKAQTKNGGSFFSDNESWGNFPLVKTDGSGNWSGQVFGLITEEKEEGVYKVRLRAKKKDADTFYESEIKEVSFTRSSALSPLPPLPRATVSASSPSSTRDQYNLVLGTGSSSLASLPTPTKGENAGATRQRDWFSLGLIFSGLAISLGAMVIFFYKEEIWQRFYGIIKRDEA